MKPFKLLLGGLGAMLAASSGGCLIFFNNPPPPDQTGDIEFNYVLLQPDAVTGQIVAATSCADAGVSAVRFMVGDDLNGNGILDDNEINDEDTSGCNQLDANGDGTIDQGDFGLYQGLFFADSYDQFAVEFLDAGGNAISWQTFDTSTNFTRFSFGGGITIDANTNNNIPFNGDAQQTSSKELQAFFGF